MGLAKSLWEMKGQKWPYLCIGLLVGITQVSFPDPDNPERPSHGLNRLFKILVSDSACLIWLLRCERVIEHQIDIGPSMRGKTPIWLQ
jgi:hypothetical protein